MRQRGLHEEYLAELIERDPDWHAVRNCHWVKKRTERIANAARAAAYRDRLALSRDPWAAEDIVARRQIVGLRVKAALLKRERIKHLRARLRAQVPHRNRAALPDFETSLRRRAGCHRITPQVGESLRDLVDPYLRNVE